MGKNGICRVRCCASGRSPWYKTSSTRWSHSSFFHAEFVVAGQGMGGVHRKKTISLTDLYAGDIDFLPFDGQAALKEIEKNKIRRARERTMQVSQYRTA